VSRLSLKRFSYCNNSTKSTKNKAFLLLEAVAALAVLLGMASVLLMATCYAVHYRAQARLLRGALLQTAQSLDEALYTHKPAGTFVVDGYTIQIDWIKNPREACRITTSWGYNNQTQSVVLTSAVRASPHE
jgi:type II secretory pathway pseudopilin PulG